MDEPELGSGSPPSSTTPDLEVDKNLYDNPLFEDETKIDLGLEAGKAPLEDVPEVGATPGMNVYEPGPGLSANGAGGGESTGKEAPKLDKKYQRFF